MHGTRARTHTHTIGKIAPDDLRLSALDLKANFKLMMVGSLEADIQDVCNAQFDTRDVIDDFDDDHNDEKSSYSFHRMEVNMRTAKSKQLHNLSLCVREWRADSAATDVSLFGNRINAGTRGKVHRPAACMKKRSCKCVVN